MDAKKLDKLSGRNAASLAVVGMMALSAAYPAVAAAQEDGARDSGGAQVGEIVVTAQRREESLQKVPISVSAVEGDYLASVGITKIDDLGTAVPGLVAIPQLNSFSPIIRGIGQVNLAPGADLGVATYIDGVYQASPSGSNLSIGEIQRVEVLRGPQGTLFGRNATGGVVSIVTADPKHETQGYVSAAISDPLTYEGKFYVTGGLTDAVAASFAGVITDQKNGFGQNLQTGTDTYYRDDLMLRGKILADLSDTATLRLAGDYNRTTTDFGLSRRIIPNTLRIDGQPNPENNWDTLNYLDPFAKVKQWGVSGTLELDLGAVNSKTILAYRDVDTRIIVDQGWQSIPVIFFDNSFSDRTFSAETQLLSNNDDSRFEWIAGLYYLHSDLRTFPVILNAGPVSFVSNNRGAVDSYAAFAQATFNFSESTRLTLGGRYTHDKKSLQSSTTIVPVTTDRTESWSEPTWRVSLDHDIADDALIFASYNRGFKSGVFNYFDYPLATTPPVDPEFVDAFEVGFKSSLFDRSLRMNGSVYYNIYKNIQLSTIRNQNAILTNAAKAKTYGGELEIVYALTQDFSLNGNLAYTKTEYDSFPTAPAFVPNTGFALCDPVTNPANCLVSIDARGNRFSGIPEFTFNIGASYDRDTSYGGVGFDVSYFHASSRVFGFDEGLRADAYGVLSGSVWIAIGDNKENRFRLFTRNLLNEKYNTNVVAFALNNIADPAPGRVLGVEYRRSF